MDRPEKLQVCVMGLGYIGLPTAALLASRGIEVHGVDVAPAIVDTINSGRVHIVEPELDMLVQAAVASKRLHAALEPACADVFLIAVPTPCTPHQGKDHPAPDVSLVMKAAQMIAPFIRPNNLIVLESTSPVGTTEAMAQVLIDSGVDISNVDIAYCPERVLPGKVITELVENDRIVGGLTPSATAAARKFYQHFVTGTIHETNSRTAEMAKLTENAFRDVNIAFANELSMLCPNMNVNVSELIRLANRHRNVNILSPGCGVGGHCIAVDPWFIVDRDPQNAQVIRAAREVNDAKTLWVTEQIQTASKSLGKTRPVVALCGLAFKPDIDDLRGSPALKIARALHKANDAEYLFVEPNISKCDDLPLTCWEDAVTRADLVVKLVNHRVFNDITLTSKDVHILDFACS